MTELPRTEEDQVALPPTAAEMGKQTVRKDLAEALGRIKVQDDGDGLWLIFDNGSQKGSVNIGSPGPIVRRAVVGWYRQAVKALDRARAEPEE